MDPPRPQVQTWSGINHGANILPRWPNYTQWPSAWEVDGRHILQYNLTNGWHTNLVTKVSHPDGSAEFSYMGSKRVLYGNISQESGNFTMPAWPQSRNWSQPYGAEGAAPSRGFYFATKPFNESQLYTTTYRIWGNFTVLVTHLSNNDSTIACHNNSYQSLHGQAQANCSIVAKRHLQCPFTFRCFSPEMAAASGPRCLDDFDNGYNDTDLLGTLTGGRSPKDAYGEFRGCQTTSTV